MDFYVQAALDNLERQVKRVEAGETEPDAVMIAAKALLRVTSPAAVEDREYYTDMVLPAEQRCGAEYGKWGRVCSRRAGHVSPDHRDMEFSWKESAK